MSPIVTNPTCWPLLGGLFVLAVLGTAIAVLIGLYKPQEGIKKLAGLVMLLVLIPYFITTARSVWLQMPFWQRGLAVLIGIFVAVSAVHGKSSGDKR